ncbi:uncharacterized protein LOC122797873 [Protopterus annectens]|uniref:uncharacterized protein LOC122797873 n=1 Tax=Protopterus annectens TaxID=7888 RepID=UPI001CF97221|nr:uncharacterized protein LOC122797873 [Protopterus annectens]
MDCSYLDFSSDEESFNTFACRKSNPFVSMQYNRSSQHSTAAHYHDDLQLLDDFDSVSGTTNVGYSTTDMGQLDKLLYSDKEFASTSLSDINMSFGGVCSKQSFQHYSAEYGLQATVLNRSKLECNRSKILMEDMRRATPESFEHKGAAFEQNFDHQMQECNTLLTDFKEVLSAVQGVDEVRISDWLDQSNELLKLLEQTESNSDSLKTHIAVVGGTGAGKSTLLNALLDEEDLLPTSSMRACTASVVEVSYNTKNQKYEADVEFFTEQEWYTELEALIDDLRDTSGKLEKCCPDSDTEAAVAFRRVMAVYGKIAEVEELKQIHDVTGYLGRTEQITEKEVTEFHNKIERFIESSVNSSQNGKGGEYWPMVKKVQLHVPRADVLRSGTVLVDLPGVNDSNPARDSVAKESDHAAISMFSPPASKNLVSANPSPSGKNEKDFDRKKSSLNYVIASVSLLTKHSLKCAYDFANSVPRSSFCNEVFCLVRNQEFSEDVKYEI